jgi:hypothetical protein
MAETAVALQTSTKSAFRPTELLGQAQGTTHGTKTTLNLQRFITPVKLEFIVPSSQNAFNLAKAHNEILKLTKHKDPTLEIIPRPKKAKQNSPIYSCSLQMQHPIMNYLNTPWTNNRLTQGES